MRLPRTALCLALMSATLVGCSASGPPAAQDPTTGSSDAQPASEATAGGHGAVVGAAEMPEAQLALVSIDAGGNASLHDLLTGSEVSLPDVGEPLAVDTDGRYVFVSTGSGLDVLDSGRWTWDHSDHFHYYLAEPALVGTVPGDGTATLSTGMLSTAGGTGAFFPQSGEAVLLDNAELARGVAGELFRLQLPPHDGIVAPVGEGALVTVPGADGVVAELEYRDADGQPVPDLNVACPAAAGSITTRLALVVGCADGAVLATQGEDGVELEKLPYPDGAAAPATVFAARKGRPTVAGVGTDAGVWLLDTRSRSWQWSSTGSPPLLAVAADDEAGHVVVVDEMGTVQVLTESGAVVAATDPLLQPTDLAGVSLTVDAQRTYLNDPAAGVVHEIAHADAARVARTIEPAVDPLFVAEVGR